MEHKLKVLRYDLELAHSFMQHCETLNFSEETTQSFQDYLANSKHRLLREIQRVSEVLWPNTGRPYAGDWAVINRENDHKVIVNNQAECIRFVEYQTKFGTGFMKYDISKWPR